VGGEGGCGFISTRSFHTMTPMMKQILSNVISIFMHRQKLW